MNPNNAKQNFITSLTKKKSNAPFDVFGAVKNTGNVNTPGTPSDFKPAEFKPVEPKPISSVKKPAYEIPKVTPQYPFNGGSASNFNPASSVPNTGKQGFLDKLMTQFGGNKVGNALETQPATSWIYGNKQPSTTPSTAMTPPKPSISIENPFGTKTAEASDGSNPFTQPTSPVTTTGNFDQPNAFNTPTTTPTTPPASSGDGYADFIRSYQKGLSNIDNQTIPLEDITGEQAHMRQLYGDELTARAALAKDKTSTDNPAELLSVAEAQALNVPYGTTKGQAYGMNAQGKPSDANNTSALYANRIKEAEDVFSQTFPEISKMSVTELAAARLASQHGGSIGNSLLSPVLQQQFQAERNFINAVLRRESGAAIAPSEFTNAEKQYFPQPGDSVEVLAQKKQNRDTALTGLIQASGPAYNKTSNTNSGASGNNQVGIGLF